MTLYMILQQEIDLESTAEVTLEDLGTKAMIE
jgi:hypothetical protein